jgi:poly-gamma-glutamate synthesis protein (capsule biosynthesis protein)
MRVNKKYLLPNELLGKLKEIADALNINNYDNIIRAEGYLPQLKDGEQQFGPLFFEAGEKAEIIPSIHPDDMQRMLDAIAEARFMADYVVVSMHSHELSGNSKEDVDVISREFAHACIEAGADAVIGTGPHLLRGMEIYKEKPVFYGLGDFIIQLETFERAPADMYAKQKLNGNDRLDVLFNKRSDNGKRGLCYDPIMYKSVIPYWEVEAGKIVKMTFMPIEEQFCNSRGSAGFPQKNCDLGIMEHFADLSSKFGTNIRIENGLGVLEL